MTNKMIIQAALCIFFISVFFTRLAAQTRSIDGKLFLNQPRPTANFTHTGGHAGNHSPYRSFDGTNNNISDNEKANWGATNIPLFREMPPEYDAADPKNAMGGVNRPSARQISNALSDEPVTTFNARGLSSFVYIWGQFLDHDMTQTPTDVIEYAPVLLPPDEKIFTQEIPFYRSEIYPGTGVTSTRQQTNLNTSWIDASNVYGSDAARAGWLRTYKNGKMKTSAGNLLPYNTVSGEFSAAIDPNAPDMANDNNKTVKTFVAGDVRAAEHPGLTALHTLFIREHNKICDRLISQGIRNDEELYQRARKEVGALIQVITYQEFLPAMGVTLRSYSGYRSDTRPDIANSFATAGYRIGHTMVADDIILIDNQCDSVAPNVLELVDVFWNPDFIAQYNLEPFLKGLAVHTQYETDTKINSVLRNFLFVSPNDPVRFGIDLASLNIQRGRDHGLPNYNAVRKYYTGRAATKFSDITTDKTVAASLQSLYKSVNNIDLWIGILAEDHLPGKSVGKTMHEMLRVQFERLRDGDFYFYKNDPFLSTDVKNKVINTRFSDVIKRNTSLTNLQGNVFFTKECPSNTIALSSAPTEISTKPESNVIKIYPNPVSNLINVDLGNINELCTIRLSTANGALVKIIRTIPHQNTLQIHTSDLPNGIYILNILSGKGMKSFKFLKMAN